MFKKAFLILGRKNFFSLLKFIPLIFLISVLDVLGVTSLIPTLQFLSGQEISFFNIDFDFLFHNVESSYILYFFLIFIATTNLLKFFLAIINNYFFNEVTLNIQISMQKKILQDYIYGPWFQNLNKNTSEKLRDVNEETSILKTNVILPIFQILSDLIIIVSMIVFLILHADLKLFVIVFIVGLLCLFFYIINKKRLVNYGRYRRKFEKKRFQKILETINGLREIKFFNFKSKIINDFLKVSNDLKKIYLKQGVLLVIPKNLLEISVLFLLMLMILYFYQLNVSFENIVGSLAVYVVATYKIIPSFYKTMNNVNAITFATPTLNSLSKVLEEKKIKFEIENVKKEDFVKNIKFKNLSFKYPNVDKLILNNFNFEINKNTIIGIMGESGSGKSTLMDIISGLIDQTTGSIYLDDKFVNLNNEGWQKNVGIVTQKIYLFEASIKDNITLFESENDIDYDKLFESLKKVNLSKYANTKDVLEKIHEDGINLSGGERQRLGLARCLYQNRNLLILDEPTNNLDEKSENIFYQTLQEIKKEKTVIIVSHNQKLYKYCDKIFLIKNNKLFVK